MKMKEDAIFKWVDTTQDPLIIAIHELMAKDDIEVLTTDQMLNIFGQSGANVIASYVFNTYGFEFIQYLADRVNATYPEYVKKSYEDKK